MNWPDHITWVEWLAAAGIFAIILALTFAALAWRDRRRK